MSSSNGRGPSPNGAGGRDGRGRFVAGNTHGTGNPFARRTAQLRATLLNAITPEELEAIVKKLIDLGQAGDVAAAREVLTRAVGRPLEADLLQRLEVIEQALGITQQLNEERIADEH